MSEISINLKIENEWVSFPFSKLSLIREAENPARSISVETPEIKWMGNASEMFFECESYSETFLVDKQVYEESSTGVVQKIEGRSKIGALLLDNQIYPEMLENISLQNLIDKYCVSYGVRSYTASSIKTLPLFLIQEGSSIWDTLKSFIRLAYNQNTYFSNQNTIQVGVPDIESTHVFSNAEENGVCYSNLQYSFIPKYQISKIEAMDESGTIKTYKNTLSENVERVQYWRNPTNYNKNAVKDPQVQIYDSLWKSYALEIETPFFFLGNPNDKGVFPDLEMMGSWQIEKGTWEWNNGWSTKLLLTLKNYRGK